MFSSDGLNQGLPPLDTAPRTQRVCVIGAGVSGLVVTKELRAIGLAVTCYEMMPIASGVFGSHTWKDGRLTSSTMNTFFSDFPVENRQTFMSWRDFCDYLERYIDHFDLRSCINLNCKVILAKKITEGWQISGIRRNFSNGHRFHPGDNAVEASSFSETFTHLVVCAGLHQHPNIPDIPGIGSFEGELIHSSEYRNAEDYQGKVVAVVGAGESGSDIVSQVAPLASECYISLRSSPGTLFPKWIQGSPPDSRDDLITYNLPRAFKPIILKAHANYYGCQKETPELFEWAKNANFKNNRCSFNSAACKSFGIPTAVVQNAAEIRPSIRSIEGNTVFFQDGTQVNADALLFCTGFKTVFPFLEDSISHRIGCISHLWKNMLVPTLDETLSFVGFARPHQINLLSISEIQARTLAAILSGHRQLPSAESMLTMIEADRRFMKKHYRSRAETNPALVDHIYFTESLASFIGCTIPWKRVWRKNPKLALKLIYSAMHGAHHRLQGPGANWNLAEKTVMETPLFNNRKSAVSRWLFLTVLTLVARFMSLFNAEYRSTGAIAHQQMSDYAPNRSL